MVSPLSQVIVIAVAILAECLIVLVRIKRKISVISALVLTAAVACYVGIYLFHM